MTTPNPFSPYFLGAYAENNDVFESIWLEFYREHVYWRRSYHPEDTPPIRPTDQLQADYLEEVAKTKQSLHKLSARLKQSVPFYHPRYIGHMASDLLMPGLLGQMITTLYNPNNVSSDAAPVTVDLELEYGEKLARMFGLNTRADKGAVAFGHLTSGGTVANYQGVWYAQALKYYPLALQKGVLASEHFSLVFEGRDIASFSQWELFNFSFDRVVQLRETLFSALKDVDKAQQKAVLAQISDARIETLGAVDFFAQFSSLKPPVLLVPTTAHYSWQKAAKILGIGTRQIVKIPTDEKMRICTESLSSLLTEFAIEQQPILALVGVMGTTEYGTIDPIDQIVALREQSRAKGLEYFIHIDAAWGGYLSSMFRAEDDTLLSYEDVKQGHKYFPSRALYQAIGAMDQVESITIDPHKLGYLPFGCGAFVCRNKGARGFVIQEAPYVFEGDKYSMPEPELGQYIFEGSKPGATAAGVSVAAEVLPFHHKGLGRLPKQTIKVTEYFYDQFMVLAEELKDKYRLVVPIDPDTNLICIAINPANNRDVGRMNQVMQRFYKTLRVDASVPLQTKRFFTTNTKIMRSYLSDTAAAHLCDTLGLDTSSFTTNVQDETQSDHLYVLRHTLMNPWLTGKHGNYVDGYLAYLKELLLEACDSLTD